MVYHGLICFVGQPVQPQELDDFTSRWGEVIELTGGLTNENQEPGVPSITRVGNIRPDGSIIHDVHFAEYWHHDGDFWAPGKNFLVNFLSGAVIPSVGGQTGFLDTRRAYEILGDAQRKELEGASICVRASEISDFQNATPDELPPDAEHPVLFPHPVSQQIALYLPDSSTGIRSRDGALIGSPGDLIDPLMTDLGIYEHVWEVDDLLITDNLQVMHRSMGGYGDEPRLLYRCQARLSVLR
jgi:taurine dioxygenase